jgi:hypothetical protein
MLWNHHHYISLLLIAFITATKGRHCLSVIHIYLVAWSISNERTIRQWRHSSFRFTTATNRQTPAGLATFIPLIRLTQRNKQTISATNGQSAPVPFIPFIFGRSLDYNSNKQTNASLVVTFIPLVLDVWHSTTNGQSVAVPTTTNRQKLVWLRSFLLFCTFDTAQRTDNRRQFHSFHFYLAGRWITTTAQTDKPPPSLDFATAFFWKNPMKRIINNPYSPPLKRPALRAVDMGNSTVLEADSEQALVQLPMPMFPQIITPSNVARVPLPDAPKQIETTVGVYRVFSHGQQCILCGVFVSGHSSKALMRHIKKCTSVKAKKVLVNTNWSRTLSLINMAQLSLEVDSTAIVHQVVRLWCFCCNRHFATRTSFIYHQKHKGCTAPPENGLYDVLPTGHYIPNKRYVIFRFWV